MITIDTKRILSNADLVKKDEEQRALFAQIDIDPNQTILDIRSGRIVVIDPTYLADIYNGNNEKEMFLKENGVLLTDFNGEYGGLCVPTKEGGLKFLQVFDTDAYETNKSIILPGSPEKPEKTKILVDGLACDSGSYIFLDYSNEFRKLFKEEIISNQESMLITRLRRRKYLVAYEQWELPPDEIEERFARNLVVLPIR